MSLAKLIATWFGSGLSPKAPGTAGSLAALPVVYLCHALHLMPLLAGLTILLYVVGLKASAIYMREAGRMDDPKEIVVDEVVGQWLVFAAMPLMYLPASYDMQPQLLLMGFVAFRFFDIVKPWPVSWADRKEGALGVMLDDVIAALMALATLAILGHLWMGIAA